MSLADALIAAGFDPDLTAYGLIMILALAALVCLVTKPEDWKG